MGIPGIYSRLVERYPQTICRFVEEVGERGEKVDVSGPNPNGVEFDNLYIDMNGIIHPCFHPENLDEPSSYSEIIFFIFQYLDRVFSIVRPRSLLYLAIDGVAPRAKMNHQRIRRFRSAKESKQSSSSSSSSNPNNPNLDANVITPGTHFMELLSFALKHFVTWKMNHAPGWQDIKVIVSDSSVVGEGEFKIMSFIRSQRNLPGYNPNTRHCIHGMDADLIMLALATHEIHVSILREVTSFKGSSQTRKKHHNYNCYPFSMQNFIDKQDFEFFNIWVLREYLQRDLLPNIEGVDFERLVDDFIFFCVFIGNDFLPHLPTVDIREGGIDLLLLVYQKEFLTTGYLTDAPKVNLKSMEHFLQALSIHEKAFFLKRGKSRVIYKKHFLGYQYPVVANEKDVYLWHYTKNFDCESHDIDRIKSHAVLKYTEGICWIMDYYYQGLSSWQWFYPYHYAPFPSDFCDLDKLEINFTLGQPLKPLDQLLAVLPAASAQALPFSYRELMTNKSSPILDFYPNDAVVERNGRKFAWQGVCKLPFIDESRLLSEALKVESTLTDEEKQRNRFGRDMLFVHLRHPLSKFIEEHHLSDPSAESQIQITHRLSDGVAGYLCNSDKPVCPNDGLSRAVDNIRIPGIGSMLITKNDVISVFYKSPSHVHIPKLLCGVIMPPRIVRSPRNEEKIKEQVKASEKPAARENLDVEKEQDSKRKKHKSNNIPKEGVSRKINAKVGKECDLVNGKEINVSRVEEISGVGVDENMNGFPIKKTKKKRERPVNEENEEKIKKQVKASERPAARENMDVEKEQVSKRKKHKSNNIPKEGVSRKINAKVGKECDLVNGKEINISRVEEISGVGVDENMNGFPIKKTKKKRERPVNEENEEKMKKQVKASERPAARENMDVEKEQGSKRKKRKSTNIPKEKETENDDGGKSQRKTRGQVTGVEEKPTQEVAKAAVGGIISSV